MLESIIYKNFNSTDMMCTNYTLPISIGTCTVYVPIEIGNV